MIDVERYQGYLRPYLKQILAEFFCGRSTLQIARGLGPIPAPPWGPVRPSSSQILYILKRVGAKPSTLAKAKPDNRYLTAALLRQQGQTLKQIAAHFGVSRERARQMVAKAKRLSDKRQRIERWNAIVPDFVPLPAKNLGRPVDMGGPRDQWIEQDPWSSR